jgi:hypothetical protein
LQHPHWKEKRQYLYYKPPPTVGPNGSFALGAKEAWLERMDFLNTDLTWLLMMEQFRYMLVLKVHKSICSFGCVLKKGVWNVHCCA